MSLHSRPIGRLVAVVAVAMLCVGATARAGDLNASASCPDGLHIVVEWGWYETPGSPAAYPEWVGYDILRRTEGDCDAPWVRLNADPIPRVVGQSHSGSLTEIAPALHTTFQYKVVPVDASHQPVIMSSIDCDPPCVPHTWASCPDLSGIATVARVVDWGWTVFLGPCAGACWPSFYVANPSAVAELRPYIGSGQVFTFYGGAGCGSVEGCSLNVTHFELTDCGPTPTTRPSWGRVKSHYR